MNTQIENFNIAHCQELYNNDLYHGQPKEYIKRSIYPLTNGSHLLFENNEYQIIETKVLQGKLNRLPTELSKFYFNELKQEYSITINTRPQILQGSYINLFGGFKNTVKSYNDFSDEIKNGVSTMLDFIKTVLCSGNENTFNYMQKWIANMCRGNKNDSLLYLKGDEGVGKSTLSDFLVEYVLGRKIAMKSGSYPLVSGYNKSLMGKLLVVFEELPTFSKSEWEGVSAQLKEMITGTTYNYNDKYEKMITCHNLNNYIINTNVSAIQHNEGRRYCILDLSKIMYIFMHYDRLVLIMRLEKPFFVL